MVGRFNPRMFGTRMKLLCLQEVPVDGESEGEVRVHGYEYMSTDGSRSL